MSLLLASSDVTACFAIASVNKSVSDLYLNVTCSGRALLLPLLLPSPGTQYSSSPRASPETTQS